MVTLAVKTAAGKQLVRIRRAELVRRAMAATVARRVMDLVEHHHRTEAGRSITLDHQWKQIYADPATDMRIIAPAQRGKTLYETVKTLAQVSLGMSVGWVMPKEKKVQEFVHGKLNPTIKATPLYSQLVEDSGGHDTVGFKQFGQFGKLYIVTANSENELTSFSADAMHIDERDFCNRQNLPMYTSRMNWSPYKLTDECSTPTVDGSIAMVGQHTIDNIHSEWLNGDQHRYHTDCPYCGTRQILDWYENVIEIKHDESGRVSSFNVRDLDWSPGNPHDIRVCCRACDRPFERTIAGRWIALAPGVGSRTYWVESLASSVGPPLSKLLDVYQKALGNPSKLQHFHNMDLGRPFAGGMMRFTEDLFERCADAAHVMLQQSDHPTTIGIDVNRPWLDVHISQWREGRQIKVHVCKMDADEDRVVALCKRFNVAGGVIDNQPEVTFATRLQERLLNELGVHLVRCKYATDPNAKSMTISEKGETKVDPPRLITVNRTVAVDELYESMLMSEVTWFGEWRGALDGALLNEFRNPVRKLTINDAGAERFTWEGKPDHQLHAGVYDRLAGKVLEMDVVRDYSEIGPVITPVHTALPSIPDFSQPLILMG